MDSHKKSPSGRCNFTGKDTEAQRGQGIFLSKTAQHASATSGDLGLQGLSLALLTNPSHPKERGIANVSAHPMRLTGLRPRYANDYLFKADAPPAFLQGSIYGLLTGEEMWSSWSAQTMRRPKRSQTPAFKNVASGPCKSTARGCKTPEQNCLRTHLM
uniref:Uncharacterized protein n=1 Tax=Myotis myotis TaxID=51298 RepID=A0A7J8AMG5_MYOMY|nr:hypothetical protein mMyoMyo1_008103 [Myotis myotis]